MRFAATLLLLGCAAATGHLQPTTINVSIASSLMDAMGQVGRRFEAVSGIVVRLNSGSSNTLARQIVEGAPVDVFFSADEAQMDVVERAGRLVSGSRVPLLSNQLVLIRPRDAAVRVSRPADLVTSHVRRVALGNPDSVPAGVYARQWLEKLQLWNGVKDKVVPLPTVRAALAAVRESRVQAGVVYVTDTRASSGIEIVYVVPVAESPRIVYPVAAIRGRHEDAAARLLQFLQGDEARVIFQAAGFAMSTP
jgi:molybdate transport system substrate-binding protein